VVAAVITESTKDQWQMPQQWVFNAGQNNSECSQELYEKYNE